MAATQCRKACGADMPRVIVELWPYASEASKTTFCTGVLGQAALIQPDINLQAMIQNRSNAITYNQMLSIVDMTVNNWQVGVANVVDIAKAASNAPSESSLLQVAP